MISPVRTEEQRRIAEARVPLEARLAWLRAEIRHVQAELREIGVPSLSRAAIRYVGEHPGARTDVIVSAVGIRPTLLSHLAKRGELRNERGAGSRIKRWFLP